MTTTEPGASKPAPTDHTATEPTTTEPILRGVRVVDMTHYLAGPTVTRMMAELGADIVKIEQPPYGDASRTLGVIRHGRSGYFVSQNRGKRSLCLDITSPQGRCVLDELIARADVVVENYGPGVLEKRGLGWADLHARHPRLIMASISGFGRQGAFSHKASFDSIAQAFSGIMALTGPADGPPMPVGTPIGDVSAGVHAVAGIGMALFRRERTGRGQHIDISMVDALAHSHDMAIQGPPLTGGRWTPKRSGQRSALNAPMGVYRGVSGWIVLHVMQGQWGGFCRAVNHPEWEHDERFSGLRERNRHCDELNTLIEEWMATQPDDEGIVARLDAHRVPCALVLEPHNIPDHPYFVDRGAVRRVSDRILGEVVVPGNPLRFSEQPDHLELVAPFLGEHNTEVLAELGYDQAAIDCMIAEGIVHRADT